MSAGKIQQLLMERSNDGGLAPASGIPALAPRVRQLRDYWESKQRGRALPARADFDSSEIKPLLPCLIIADLFADPLRVRFRLAGTKVCEAFGLNIAGRWLEELDVAADIPFGVARYGRMTATRAPVYGRTTGKHGGFELFRSDWPCFRSRAMVCGSINAWRSRTGPRAARPPASTTARSSGARSLSNSRAHPPVATS